MSFKGHHHTLDTRVRIGAKMSKLLKGNQHMLGKKFSLETRTRMSEARKGKCLSQECKAKISASRTGMIFSKETRAKLSESHKQFFLTPNGIKTRAHLSEIRKGNKNMLGHSHSVETIGKLQAIWRERLAKGIKYGFGAMDREQLQEAIRKSVAANCAKPNQAEVRLMELIDEACPNEYRYTGNASIKIAGLFPDFFNVNGQKKVIELFGNYWHSTEVITRKSWKATELGRIMAYNSYGFDCLIVWEKDLKTKTKKELIATIRNFNKMRFNQGRTNRWVMS